MTYTFVLTFLSKVSVVLFVEYIKVAIHSIFIRDKSRGLHYTCIYIQKGNINLNILSLEYRDNMI